MQKNIPLDEFTEAYIECALWSSTDDDDEPLDKNHNRNDISQETLETIIADCTAFQSDNASDIENEWSQAGNDFWLTRNDHGAGFWDGDWEDEAGKRLTAASKAYGECNLYIGDDGLIYIA